MLGRSAKNNTIMKNTIASGILSIISLTLFTSCEKKESAEMSSEAISNPEQITEYTNQERDLLKGVNAMFEKKDVSDMMQRVYKDKDFGELNTKIQKEYLEDIIKKGMSSFELERISPPETEQQGHDGKVYKWSLPLKWKLIIHEPKNADGFNASYLIHLSDHQNRLVIIRELAPTN
jgi:hypothetical protein